MAKILVADDDDLLREFLTIRLALCGHRITEAADGHSALDHITAENFDLVLMDDVMPALSGLEVLAAARQLPHFDGTVILMSQKPHSVMSWKTGTLGVSHCLQKPFCAQELTSLVKTLCEPEPMTNALRQGLRSAFTSAALFAAAASPAVNAQSVDQTVDAQEAAENNTPFDIPTNASNEEPAPNTWTIGALHQWSAVASGAQPTWQDTQISVEFAPKKTALYSLDLSKSSRFGLKDHHVAVRGDWRVARNASVYAGFAASPEGNFKEKWSFRAGGGVGLGRGLELSADGRVAHYSSGTKLSLNPQLGISLARERIALTAGWINLWETGGKHYQGWSARVRATPNDRLRLFAGMARYPEVETGITRRVKSLSGGLSYKVSDRVEASVSYARDNYAGAFSRKSISVGLRWRWGSTA